MDIYKYMGKKMEEKVLGVVWKRGALLLFLFVLLLWPWWVSVSLVLELLLSLSSLSFFLSLSEEDDYERQPGMNWSLVLSLLIATSIKS